MDVGRCNLILLASFLLTFSATSLCAQTAPQSAASGRIQEIAIKGSEKVATPEIIAASGLRVGDIVGRDQIQAAADRLAALGIFDSVNFHFTSKGDTLSIEFEVKDAPTVPVSFDNFVWFTDDELAAAIREKVGFFGGFAPQGGTLVDEMSKAIDDLLAKHAIPGRIEHSFISNPTGDGMIQQFRADRPDLIVQSVEFGDPLATNSERLKDRLSDIKGQVYSRYKIDVFDLEQVRPIYDAAGHLRARIGPSQAHLASGAAAVPGQNGETLVAVTIPIEPGPVFQWRGVTWLGSSVISTSTLDQLVGFKPGDVANGLNITAAWQRVADEFSNHGYLDANLDFHPEFDDAAHQVSYRVTINEGAQYHMGDLVITGLSLEAERRLRAAWQIPTGQVFNGGYFEKLLTKLATPSEEIFGDLPVHYAQPGHWLQKHSDAPIVDVLLDFK